MPQDVLNISMPAFWTGYLVGATFVSLLWLLNGRRGKK